MPIFQSVLQRSTTIKPTSINYSNRELKECPDLIRARIDHEATHAIRFVFALQQDEENKCKEGKEDTGSTEKDTESKEEDTTRQVKKQKTEHSTPPLKPQMNPVPKKTPPRIVPSDESRYKLTEPSFHSGYLVEHLKNGGIVVSLRGCLELGGKVVEGAKYARVQTVRRCKEKSDWDIMECELWDEKKGVWSASVEYRFNGRRITRRGDG